MNGIIKPISFAVISGFEVAYVIRHPRRSYRHFEIMFRRWLAARDVDRSAAKQRHPAMLNKPAEFREEAARRDVERILAKAPAEWSESLPTNHPVRIRRKGRK